MARKYVLFGGAGIIVVLLIYAMMGNWYSQEQVTRDISVSERSAVSAMSNAEAETAPKITRLESETATALVAGGCFWCVEADLEKLPGVIEAVSGYAGGETNNPTYATYSSTGHREVVEVTYDPTMVTFEEIIIYTLKHTDPTDGDGSFGDRGEYYSPALYYETAVEKEVIERVIKILNEKGPYQEPLAVDVEARPVFYKAEAVHQDYYLGTLTGLQYKAYRKASGRDAFIKKHWGDDTGPALPYNEISTYNKNTTMHTEKNFWHAYQRPSEEEIKSMLTPLQYKVTQKDGTEPPFDNKYDGFKEEGIYVDLLSGEPLFSSTDKYDSGTGWPSFTKPIDPSFVTEHTDYKLILPRTEIRSAIADSHLGHVFSDGPKDEGGKRYCMNSAALLFIPVDELTEKGYGDFLHLFS